MNKKGFVLMETLVVTIFALIIFTILYTSTMPLLGRYNELSYYDDLDTTYDLYYLKNMIVNDNNYKNIISNNFKKITCTDLSQEERCYLIYDFLGIKNDSEVVYLNTNYYEELKESNDISSDIKDYLKYKDLGNNVLILERDGYISYLNLLEKNQNASTILISNEGTDGLVAINQDGLLYDKTDSTQEIREYRYSGLEVNNYVFLDNNGDGKRDANEIWRIVGIFKNSSGEWNLKLMRNTVLQADEIANGYTHNGVIYGIKHGDTNRIYWNVFNTATNYSDWTTSKFGYWLNDATTNGYFGTLSSSIQSIIDINYTYYLGNHKYKEDTTISAYTNERDANNIWEGNHATWNGKVALLYPSDYGYSASSAYWSETTLYNYSLNATSTSWMEQSANPEIDCFLSPSSSGSGWVADWIIGNGVGDFLVNSSDFRVARPVINLKSTAKITDGTGHPSDPYKIS